MTPAGENLRLEADASAWEEACLTSYLLTIPAWERECLPLEGGREEGMGRGRRISLPLHLEGGGLEGSALPATEAVALLSPHSGRECLSVTGRGRAGASGRAPHMGSILRRRRKGYLPASGASLERACSGKEEEALREALSAGGGGRLWEASLGLSRMTSASSPLLLSDREGGREGTSSLGGEGCLRALCSDRGKEELHLRRRCLLSHSLGGRRVPGEVTSPAASSGLMIPPVGRRAENTVHTASCHLQSTSSHLLLTHWEAQ